MLVDGLYVIIDRKTGLFYNAGELKNTPKIYTKKGGERVLTDYKRAKRLSSFGLMSYKIPYYHGQGLCVGYICNFDLVECTLSAKNDVDRKGHRRGCKPKGRKLKKAPPKLGKAKPKKPIRKKYTGKKY
jgi:hypothetical protein